MDARRTELWVEGFCKAAADAGITDPPTVERLLKMAHRRHVAAERPEAYRAGQEAVLAQAEKSAAPGALMRRLPMLGMLAGGMLAGTGIESLGRRGMQTLQGLGDQNDINEFIRRKAKMVGDYQTRRNLLGPQGMGSYGPGVYGSGFGSGMAY